MSIKGIVEASCPAGCESFEVEVWSFIHGAKSPALREAALVKECNLLICPGCGAPFFAEAPYIYFDPDAEILMFVFPDSFRREEARWRLKMGEDHLALKRALGKNLPVDLAPELCFGPEGLSALLRDDDCRDEEREVMEFLARDLGLSVYRISPRFARRRGLPAALPYAPAPGEAVTRASLIDGLRRLLAANDRLTTYQACLDGLLASADAALPPART